MTLNFQSNQIIQLYIYGRYLHSYIEYYRCIIGTYNINQNAMLYTIYIVLKTKNSSSKTVKLSTVARKMNPIFLGW